MSRKPWGLKTPQRIRCCYRTGEMYHWRREEEMIPKSCRAPAVAALVYYPFKNGNSTRPFPLCEKHRKGWKWNYPHVKKVRKEEITLDTYVQWLRGKVTIGYRREPGRYSDAK